jgi:hypothetical protein
MIKLNKFLLEHRLIEAFAVFFFIFMFMVGCETNTVSSSNKLSDKHPASTIKSQSSITANSSTFTDKEIFKGTVLFSGPVANHISYINNNLNINNFGLNQSTLNEINSLYDDLLTTIENNEPTFFSDFANALRTGNQLAIENKLIEASEIARMYAFHNQSTQSDTDDYLLNPDPDPPYHDYDPKSNEDCEDPTLPCENSTMTMSSSDHPSLYDIVDVGSSTVPLSNEDVAIANYIFLFNHIAIFLELFIFGYFFIVAFLFIGGGESSLAYDDLSPLMKDQLIQSIYQSNL